MVFRPKYYYKVGTGGNGLAVNVIDIKGIDTYPTTTLANAAGYALCRSFIDGGVEVCGKFDDKYFCSANGIYPSSIKNGLPLSAALAHNPFSQLPAGSNIIGDAIRLGLTRNNRSYCMSIFDKTSLARISLAHAQASSSITLCAWYGAANFPKGCNNNSLGDVDDGGVTFTSDGYLQCCKTGSGNPFEKTTHNGQTCGVADVNGVLYSALIGSTWVAGSYLSISAATNANPCQLTFGSPHGLTGTGIGLIVGCSGMTQLNNLFFTYTYVDPTNLTINVDSTAFGVYSGSGLMYWGTFYIAKNSVSMRQFTSGNTLSTDHFGITGASNMMQSFVPKYNTTYPNNISAQLFGNGANQVFSEATSGDDWLRTCAGLPMSGGTSPVGTSVFGNDYSYQAFTDEMIPMGNGAFNSLNTAGIWEMAHTVARSGTADAYGFRCSSLPLV
jgi:hypothetical protein